MASKNNSNSNKTAHVMNLLRKNNVPATEENVTVENNVENVQAGSVATTTQTQAPAQTQTSNVQSTQQKPHVITSLNADTEISLNIRDALSDALNDEEKETEPTITNIAEIEAPREESEKIIENNTVVETVKEEVVNSEEKATQNMPVIEVVNKENTDSAEQKTQETSADNLVKEQTKELENTSKLEIQKEKPSDESVLINMMQLLVEEKVDKYMKLTGVCTCKNCRNDVIALALNKLSAKYVVMKPSEMAIRSDMYKNRYSGEIIAQLLCACDKVKENPIHQK